MAAFIVSFFDVGQGDGTFVRFPNNATMLVDLGSTKNLKKTYPEVAEYFEKIIGFKRGQTNRIKYLFLTHGDSDHYNMLPYLINDFNVEFDHIFIGGKPEDYFENYNKKCSRCGKASELGKKVVVKDTFVATLFSSSIRCRRRYRGTRCNNRINYLRAEINKLKIPAFDQWLYDQHKAGKINTYDNYVSSLKNLVSGSTFFVEDQVEIQIMAANVISGFSSKNTGSIVIRLYDKRSRQAIMLSGDATYVTEAFILECAGRKGFPLNTTVLKMGHHGSSTTSTSAEWAKALQSEFVFISVDRTGDLMKDKSGHRLPRQAAIDTLLQYGSPKLSEDSESKLHCYMAHYKPTDFGVSRSVNSFGNAHGTNPVSNITLGSLSRQSLADFNNHYYEIATKKRIYTTLAKLDYGPKKEDLGTRYDLEIKSSEISVSNSVPPDFKENPIEDLDGWTADELADRARIPH